MNDPRINRHPSVPDSLIYKAIYNLNDKYKVKIDPEQFFDIYLQKFCTSEIKDGSLELSFPVYSSSQYAKVKVPLENKKLNLKEIYFNDAFKSEINRSKERKTKK